VVNNGKQFWKKYFPAGSTIDFQLMGHGIFVIDAMVAGKQHLGYMGDMPGIEGTFRYLKPRGGVDIRIVAIPGTSQQMCNNFLVRKDAPSFQNSKEALQWMNGKVFATLLHTCSDRFARLAFEASGVKPKEYLNQTFDLLGGSFRSGTIDAATVWEPVASKLIKDGLARRVATGKDFDLMDSAIMVMLNDLIEQRPDIHKAWLQAELDSQLFLADPAHAEEVIDMVKQQIGDTLEVNKDMLREALYGGEPGEVKLQFDFIVNDKVRKFLDEVTAFLSKLPKKVVAAPKMRPEGVMDEVGRQILKERGLTSPVGVIKGGQK
jgi:NitT/TauT family transport system substrate-binding protein